jgi:hypothetical protein
MWILTCVKQASGLIASPAGVLSSGDAAFVFMFMGQCLQAVVNPCMNITTNEQHNHQVLRETIKKYAPQATVDQVTLTLGGSGEIYDS